MDLFSKTLSQLAVGNVPDRVLQYFKAGQVSPLVKPTGGHRPLLLSPFLRRLAHKALLKTRTSTIQKAVGPHQYGVSTKDGANVMIKKIQVAAEMDTQRVLVALDIKAAFQNISRKAMINAIAAHDHQLACV